MRETLAASGDLFDGYHPKMELLHRRNAAELTNIIDKIGYPTSERVGPEASEAAWIIAQHAISLPCFLKRCAALLTDETNLGRQNQIHLAYLTDRVAVFEGRPQLFGTHFDWNEAGELVPQPFDDAAKVDERRKQLGLVSLAEQTAAMQAQAKQEGAVAPPYFEQRKRQYDNWRRQVGWI